MAVIGYHASHEQLAPSALVDAVQRAEAAGFQAAMCSDHLAPWSTRQGHSGHSWAWLGAALQAASLPFGVVIAPGQGVDGDQEDCVLLDLLDSREPEYRSDGSTVELLLGGDDHMWLRLQPRERTVAI